MEDLIRPSVLSATAHDIEKITQCLGEILQGKAM